MPIRTVVTVDVTPKTQRIQVERCDREELKQKTQTPESTLSRYLEFVAEHIPEFGYTPNQTEFDDFQQFTIAWLRNLYSQGKRKADILKRLQNGELLDEYQESTQNRISA